MKRIEINRSEGACHRNGLFHSCACGRVAGVVCLPGPAGRLGFVAPRRRAAAPPRRSPWGVGVFRGTFPGTGPIRMCSPDRDLQNVL